MLVAKDFQGFGDGWGIKSFEGLCGDDLGIYGGVEGVGCLLLYFRKLCIRNVGVEGMMHSLPGKFGNEAFLDD